MYGLSYEIVAGMKSCLDVGLGFIGRPVRIDDGIHSRRTMPPISFLLVPLWLPFDVIEIRR